MACKETQLHSSSGQFETINATCRLLWVDERNRLSNGKTTVRGSWSSIALSSALSARDLQCYLKPGPFSSLGLGTRLPQSQLDHAIRSDCTWHSSRNIKPSHADHKPVGLSMPVPASYSRRSFLITGQVAASALLNCTSRSTQSGYELMSNVARPLMSAMAQNSRWSCSNNRVHYYYKLHVQISFNNTEFYAST